MVHKQRCPLSRRLDILDPVKAERVHCRLHRWRKPPPYRAPWLHTLGVIADADLRHARPCSVIWIGQRNLVLACAIKLV
ncbi:hypothetical protein ACI0FS_23270 [Ochrobactrum quorumnocens]|uniref:hypothetical protein n=1 Tax=Ochrobactrum quorumnocens TaxID=271865 RepID=UPI0038552DE7